MTTHMLTKTRRDQKGFSLVEVMVAVVILTIGLLALAQLMVMATRSNALSGRMTSSAAIAKERLELLKAAPFYTNATNRTVNPLLGGDLAANATVGNVDSNVANYFAFYDADGQPTPANTASGALYLVRWEIRSVVTPGSNGTLPLAMRRIRVRCLPAQESGNMFQVIGDATFVTFRTANVG